MTRWLRPAGALLLVLGGLVIGAIWFGDQDGEPASVPLVLLGIVVLGLGIVALAEDARRRGGRFPWMRAVATVAGGTAVALGIMLMIFGFLLMVLIFTFPIGVVLFGVGAGLLLVGVLLVGTAWLPGRRRVAIVTRPGVVDTTARERPARADGAPKEQADPRADAAPGEAPRKGR